MNEANIAKNKLARGAPANSYRGGRGGGRGVGRGGGRGDAGRGRGGYQPRGRDRPPTNYDARGKFGAPEPHERVRVIDGKAMVACRTCGWNEGAGCHSSGSHELSLERGYVTSLFLQHEMDVAMERNGETANNASGDTGRASGAASGTSTALTLHGMAAKCSLIEANHEDADASKLAGMFSSLLEAMAKE